MVSVGASFTNRNSRFGIVKCPTGRLLTLFLWKSNGTTTNLLLNLIAALIVCIFMIPFLGVIFCGADSLFVYPYYHLLTQLVPRPSRELIRKDFEPIIRFLCAHVDIEKKKDLRHILRYEESEFTEPLSTIWRDCRAMFLEHELQYLARGRRAYVQFLIERHKQAEDIAELAHQLGLTFERWSQECSFMYYDLSYMLEEQSIAPISAEYIQRVDRSAQPLMALIAPPRVVYPEGKRRVIELLGEMKSPDRVEFSGSITLFNPREREMTIYLEGIFVAEKEWRPLALISFRREAEAQKISLSVTLQGSETSQFALTVTFPANRFPIGDADLLIHSPSSIGGFFLPLRFVEPTSADRVC
jgi:hypothetical protein